MEVVASLSQGRTAAAQCGLFTHKSVPVIFEPPCSKKLMLRFRTSVENARTRAEGKCEQRRAVRCQRLRETMCVITSDMGQIN